MALGALVLTWTDLESALFAVLRHYCKISPKVARAIFSGTRARVMMEYLKNIAHNTGLDKDRREDLDAVLGHIGSLNKMRDWLIHHASASEIVIHPKATPKRLLTNRDRVGKSGNEFVVMVDAELVEQMCSDTITCCWHLLAHRDSEPFAPWKSNQGKSYAWLYRPPQPHSPKSKSGAPDPTPPLRRKSSPAMDLRKKKER